MAKEHAIIAALAMFILDGSNLVPSVHGSP
jgi:hypothetical protein